MKKKTRNLILSIVVTLILLLTFTVTYAVFSYQGTTGNHQLVLGDIWMTYQETDKVINIQNAMPQNLIANDFLIDRLNPIMQQQTLQKLNELDSCINYSNIIKIPLADETTMQQFCQGTGLMTFGVTFQEMLDNNMFSEELLLGYLGRNVIQENGENYIVNPIMTTQNLTILNQLNYCINSLSLYELLEGESYESFCKGTGTLNGLTFSEHRDTDSDIYTDVYDKFVEKNVILPESILADIDLPYFEFTIEGKNTYTEKDIKYEIVINNSEYADEEGIRTERIADKFLKFALVEVINGEANLVFHNISYEDLINKSVFTDTISSDDGDVNRTYRLYMWIGDEVVIGGGDVSYDYDMETWNKIYASVRVDVKGDFLEKNPSKDYVPATDSASFKRLVNNQFQDTIYVDIDGTVYLSGSNEEVNYNYVWYSGKLWRITSIAPDGTIKMITEDVMTTISWGNDYDYETSYIREWLNAEFLPTLYNYKNIIKTDSKWNATATIIDPEDANTSADLILSETKVINDSVGLLNTYEYYNSYRKVSSLMGYLNVKYYNWLLTTRISVGKTAGVWLISDTGTMYPTYPYYVKGVRPAINLLASIKLIGGDGTESNPYKISGDKENAIPNTTFINTRSSGEYVKIENDTDIERVFRIVDTELVGDKLTTKLVTNDYVRDTNDLDADGDTFEVLTKAFSDSSSHVLWSEVEITDENYWKGYLNNTWLKGLDPHYNTETGQSSILEQVIYYLGANYTESYKSTVCITSDVIPYNTSIKKCIKNNIIGPTWKGNVALLRIGEMFASQPQKFTEFNSYSHWLITPQGGSEVNYVHSDGGGSYYPPNINYNDVSARPSINLKSSIVIKSGSGTEQDPFVVGLPS